MKKITAILILGFILRLAAIFFFSDLKKDYYWEYGEIAKNIVCGNGYSLFYFNDNKLENHFLHFNIDAKPFKSAYMPPGYVIFLSPFMVIENVVLRNIFLLVCQSLISLFTIYLLYKLCVKLFSERTAFIAALTASILPEFVYAVLSFTPTIIYHLLILGLFWLILYSNDNIKHAILIASLISLIIYFRVEFALFAAILIISFILKKNNKYSITIFITIIVLIIPWSLRNYFTFHKFVPLTTSFGLNFYRGNNQYGIGFWGDKEIYDEINKLEKNNSFEINMNKIYEDKAFDFIKNNPFQFLKNGFVKISTFWIFNPDDKRTNNALYIFPALFLFIFFVFGLIKSFSWNKYKLFYLFFIYSTAISMIFFPMLRYQTMMKIMMVPFCAYGIDNFIVLYLKKFNL